MRVQGGVLGTILILASMVLGCVSGRSAPSTPGKPSSPLVISVIDVAGDLELSKPVLEKFRAEHPNLVSRFVYSQAPAPDLPGKLEAEERAGRLDIDLVLTGNDALAAGMKMGIWLDILPQYQASFPDLKALYSPGAWKMQVMAHGEALLDDWTPSGPLLEYDPSRVSSPPTSPQALLAWCQAHPGKFMYARPANSGPGRTFVMGLPYLLGDKDPSDPVSGWAKTWAYLKQLNDCIDYYPSGTGVTLRELGQGSRDIIATTAGFDVNARYLGIIPKADRIAAFQSFHWVGDGDYVAIPKGERTRRLDVVLQVIAFMLQPTQQAMMFGHGYMYPGPAVRNVPLSMAPAGDQKAIATYGRDEYTTLIANNPIEPPLGASALVKMFMMWDREIGGSKMKH